MINPLMVTDQVDQLIAKSEELRSRAQFSDWSDLPDWETEEFASRLYAAIVRLALPASTYVQQAKTAEETRPTHLKTPTLLGVLRAIKADVEAGWLSTVAEVLHADTFANFLEQSTELLDKGYKDAAAVLAGAVLEAHLKLLCQKFSVPVAQPSGAPKKATVINVDLVKAGTYGTVQQKAIDAWQGIRNSAAHGDFNDYDEIAVRNMNSGVTAFIASHPA